MNATGDTHARPGAARLLFVLPCALVIVALGCTAAAAQERDPFDPLVGYESGAATIVPGTGGTSTVNPAPAPAPAPPPAPAEQLPATGTDASTYVAIGLGLVCTGAAVYVFAATFGPSAALAASGAGSRPARRNERAPGRD